MTVKPTLTEAHNNLGNALANVGRVDEAIHEYQVAIEEDPHHADSHNNYGIALAMHGKLDEAIEQFQMAVRYKDNYAKRAQQSWKRLRGPAQVGRREPRISHITENQSQ